MKLDGRNIARNTGYATFIKESTGPNGERELYELRILVKAVPISWQDDAERLLPEPMPPVVGKQWDKHGNERPKYDPKDEKYLAARAQWMARTWAKKIYDATIDKAVQWETPAELLERDPGAFYDGVYEELNGSFTKGEIQRWLLAINAIDQVGGADVALAEEGLFQEIVRLGKVRAMEGYAGQQLDEAADGDAVPRASDLLGEGMVLRDGLADEES